MKRIFSCLLLGAGYFISLTTASAQATGTNLSGQPIRVPNSATPFLNFTPDARSGALGDAGVALDNADANSIFWNPSKLVYAKQDAGASVSYTPWLRDLIGDMYYGYFSGYKKLGKDQAIGLSLLYFDLGTINFTTSQGLSAGSFNSREYALTASYSRRLAKNFSMGVNLKYLNSNLGAGTSVNGTPIEAGSTAAADISAYYNNSSRDAVTGKGVSWAYGLMISNLGGRINYGSAELYYIPTNFRLGGLFTYHVDTYNKFNFVLDLNKLMVPTPPEYGDPVNGVRPIRRGQDPNRPFFSAVFGSFADAPGGFSEELKEITLSTGAEYWYNDQFAARVGYFGESIEKGGRQYVTAGIGARLSTLGVDFSYLLPVRSGSPLANTLRLSLLFNFNKGQRVAEDTETADTN
ncbi:type IX secretion system outer membrane channel protein PorV [Fibrella aquatilis]|uniref:Type IX secretion system outer membrane channel protein PorV n=1 Tax=Fibrella aquatilis TaxID=2817059 RepID=A0A939K1E8_9BACT|nr:type IX secretion system outer membrane channel protein PorV [Fibrella aquatilis]MBO0933443.1 type IX secretion system outer membrane channel protein PorV [Fibrella aquatilis]